MSRWVTSYFNLIRTHWLLCVFGLIWFGVGGFITMNAIHFSIKNEILINGGFPLSLYITGALFTGILGFFFTPFFIQAKKIESISQHLVVSGLLGFVGALFALLCIDFFYAAYDSLHSSTDFFWSQLCMNVIASIVFLGKIIFPIGILVAIFFSLILKKL